MNSRSKQAPSSMTVKATANGGYIATHHYDNTNAGESYQPPADHAFGSHKDMLKHFTHHSALMGGMAMDADTDKGGFGGGDKKAGKPVAAAPAKTVPGKTAGVKKLTGVGQKNTKAAPSKRTYGAGVD